MKVAIPASMLALSLVAGAAVISLHARLSHGVAEAASRYQAVPADDSPISAADADPREDDAIERLYIQSGPFSLPGRDG